MAKCGLLGEKLGHSYSPFIHNMLGDYSYEIFERSPESVEDFIKNGDWNGLNVTIPYKKTVFPFMDKIGDFAQKTGSINVIVRKPDGTLYGDNTDVYGFIKLVELSKIDVSGKKTLVLGNGGAATAVIVGLKELGAVPVIISRSGEFNYNNLELNYDAEVIVNTTPVGMYPNTGKAPLDLAPFKNLKGVIDIIYNPARPELLLQAERLGIPCISGLYMLVAQAKKAAEIFTGKEIDDNKTDEIFHAMIRRLQNIVLIGMPGCGKSTIAREITECTDRALFDADDEIEKTAGMSPAQIIKEKGEDEFRRIESSVLLELGKKSGAVIATGGGAVVRAENYDYLHQNGIIVWLRRDLSLLPSNGRPLSQQKGLERLFEERAPLYEKFADITIRLGEKHSISDILDTVYKELVNENTCN